MALSPIEKKSRLLEIAAELPHEAVEHHFTRLDNDYWNEFPVEEIHRHISILRALTSSLPYFVRIEILDEELCGLTLIGGNFTGFFAAVSGFLASRGYDIRLGKAFSFAPDSEFPALPRGGIIDFLLLSRDEGSCAEPAEQVWLQSEMEGLFRRFGSGDAAGVRVELYRRIGARLERQIALQGTSRAGNTPLDIHYHILNTETQIAVRGTDREAMLFCIAGALSLQGLSIEKLLTTTHEDGSFEDRLTLTGPGRQSLRNTRELEKIRVGIALMERLLDTLPAATDLQAAAEGLQGLVDDWLDETTALSSEGTSLEILPALARVLTAGPHLWEMVDRLGPKAFRQLISELVGETVPPTREGFLTALRASAATETKSFREREMMKAELDLLLTPARDVESFSERLVALAEALLIFEIEIIENLLNLQHGKSCPHALLAQGKFGGEEMGAGSDLEILIIYAASGETSGSKPVSHGEYHEALCRFLLKAFQTRTGETLALDMKLRPHGESGPLAVSLSAWKDYFAPGGGALDYEKQALIRMRFIEGDAELGRAVLVLRDAITYSNPAVSIAHTLDLHAQQVKLKTRSGTWNAKFSEGGMAELEYAVQFIQLAQGASKPSVRQHNMARAMESLLEAGVLTLAEFEHLYSAHLFLRRLINALRLVHGQARDLHCPLPGSSGFTFLAKRLGYISRPGSSAETQLERDLKQTQRVVNGFFKYRFQQGEKPDWLYESLSETLMDSECGIEEATPALLRLGMRDLPRARRLFLELFNVLIEKRLAAACLLLFENRLRHSPDPEGVIQKLTRYLEGLKHPDLFIRQALQHPTVLETLFTVFANSEILSGFALREGENFKLLVEPESLDRARIPEEFKALALKAADDPLPGESAETRLCRLRNREYLRIALRDLRLDVPLREITYEISLLSGALVETAFQKVLEERNLLHLKNHFCVLALGKLGGLELNYSSDIDLIFVMDDSLGESDRESCEKAGRELIAFLTKGTTEGRLFRVDMNLRPWGGQSSLVGGMSQYQNYFRTEASGWELQAWLKARPICGNMELGKDLVHEVQHHACALENREKVEESMRKVRLLGLDKLNRDKLLAGEVKLGPGGLRTVEFFAQGLQIRHGAEIPELITGNTLEALGRLTRYQLLASERFRILSDAYVFLRRVEHRLQLEGLQQRHALPAEPAELDRLARQMGFEDRIGQSAVNGFLEQYRKHILSLQPISAELFSH